MADLLSDEQREEALGFLRTPSQDSSVPPPEASDAVADTTTTVVPTTTTPAAGGDTPEAPAAEGASPEAGADEDAQGHHIPYKRFAEVNQRMKDAEATAAREATEKSALKQQLAALDGQFKALVSRLGGQPQAHVEEQEAEDDDPVSILARQQEAAQQQIQRLNVALEEQKVTAEFQAARAAYPDLPSETLWALADHDVQTATAYNRKPRTILDLAKDYSQAQQDIEDRAVARYLERQKAAGVTTPAPPAAAPKAAMPRPASVAAVATPQAESGPRNIAEASEQAYKWLKAMQE